MSTLQRLHGLPNSGASLTARHPLEPKILSHAEGDNFSPISYPPEASGYAPSGGYIVELIGHVCDTRIIYLVPGKTACMILYNTITALTAVLHADLSCGRTSSDSTLVPVSVLEIVVGSLLHHGRVDFRSKSG